MRPDAMLGYSYHPKIVYYVCVCMSQSALVKPLSQKQFRLAVLAY